MNEENTYHYFDLIKSEDEVRGKYLVFKRMFDFVFAILLAIPAIPIILIFGILVKIETPGSMFYKQERVGLMGKKIYITKIRSMYDGIEKNLVRCGPKKTMHESLK